MAVNRGIVNGLPTTGVAPLAGGVAGQILTKRSDNDYDVQYSGFNTAAAKTVKAGYNTVPVGVPGSLITSQQNRQFTASQLYLWPMPVMNRITITDWWVSVIQNTLGSSMDIRAGIYRNDGKLGVGALVSEFPKLTVPANTVAKYFTALPAPLVVNPGRYWLAWVVGSATPFLRIAFGCATDYFLTASTNSNLARITCGSNSAPIADPLPLNGPVITSFDADAGSWGPAVFLVYEET